jgi:diguanylate cyclase (GGDEF)-like protein/PAS domain S-box-containing protein
MGGLFDQHGDNIAPSAAWKRDILYQIRVIHTKRKEPPMIPTIKRWFAPPVFEGDEEKTRRANLLNIGAMAIVTIPALAILGNLIGGKIPTSTFLTALLAITIGLLLRHWLQRGKIATTGIGLMVIGFLLLTGAIASLGTIRAPTTATYLFFVILAGVLFDLRGTIFASIASSLAILGLILAENAGLLPRPDYAVTVTQWITYTALLGLTASLTYYANQTMRKALARAEKEIEERERLEMELRKLTRAVEQSPASIVITSLNGNIEYVNPRFTQVTGYRFDEVVGKNPRILKTEQTAPGTHHQLWSALAAGKEWQGEFVNRKKDGSSYYEFANISPITDLNGIATHYLAVKEDITKRKQAEADELKQHILADALRDTAEALNSTLDYNDVLGKILINVGRVVPIDSANIALLDDQNILRSIRFHGYDLHQVSEEALGSLSFAVDSSPIFKRVLETGEPLIIPDTHNDPDWIVTENGAWIRSYAVMPIRIKEKVIGVLNLDSAKLGLYTPEHINNLRAFANQVAIAVENARLFDAAEREIAERKQTEAALQKANEQLRLRVKEVEQLQAELREQALHDPLTGLYNRRYLSETLTREIVRAKRDHDPLSVIISDIDYFKLINDTYGHQVGDRYLMEVASLMKSHARGSDIVCRYGGEEFLLVLPGTPLDAAAKRAEEIRQKCEELIHLHDGKDLTVTMSFGVATYPIHGKEAEEIVIKADKALYQSKRNGRNRVTVWE